MASHDKITINTNTLVQILVQLTDKKYKGDIQIIDTIDSFTVRDCDDMKLTVVEKEKTGEQS